MSILGLAQIVSGEPLMITLLSVAVFVASLALMPAQVSGAQPSLMMPEIMKNVSTFFNTLNLVIIA